MSKARHNIMPCVDRYPFLPDTIAQAALDGNVYYPQTVTGSMVFAGRVASEMLVAGEITWPEVVYAVPTDGQRAASIARAHKVHKAYGIDSYHDSAARDITPARFSMARVDDVNMMFLPNFVHASANFAARMVKGVTMAPSSGTVFSGELFDEASQYQAIDALYERREILRRSAKPSAVALDGLWRAAYETIDPRINPLAKPHSKAWRQDVVSQYHDTVDKDGMGANIEVTGSFVWMCRTGMQAVRAAVPKIENEVDITIPSVVVDDFITTVFGVSPPVIAPGDH